MKQVYYNSAPSSSDIISKGVGHTATKLDFNGTQHRTGNSTAESESTKGPLPCRSAGAHAPPHYNLAHSGIQEFPTIF